jgi:hypothetical protein
MAQAFPANAVKFTKTLSPSIPATSEMTDVKGSATFEHWPPMDWTCTIAQGATEMTTLEKINDTRAFLA